MAPFGQVSRRFVGSYCGRCCGGPLAAGSAGALLVGIAAAAAVARSRPGQPALCWLVLRPLLRWPDRQQAALAFDHDIAGIGRGRRDPRDPAAGVMDDLGANTLRTAAGLAKAATGQQQPGPPIAFRRLLVGPPPPAPIVLETSISATPSLACATVASPAI